MAVVYPLAQLSAAAFRGVIRAFGRPTIRRWVLPVIAYEGATYLYDFLWFTLKVRASNFVLSLRSEPVERSAFLAWAELSTEDIDNLSNEDIEGLVKRYSRMRASAEPGSRLGGALLQEPDRAKSA